MFWKWFPSLAGLCHGSYAALQWVKSIIQYKNINTYVRNSICGTAQVFKYYLLSARGRRKTCKTASNVVSTSNITYPPPQNLYFGNLMNGKENKVCSIFPFTRCKSPPPINLVSCTRKVLSQLQYIVSYKSLQISVLKRGTLLNPFKSLLNKHNKQQLGGKVNMMA